MIKWHQKEQVQAAIVAGLFLVIIAMGTGLLSLYQENQKLSREVSEKINNSIYTFSESVNDAIKKSNTIDLSPHFDTFESTVATMNALNQEASIYDSTANLTEIYRLVKKYGDETSRSQLSALINAYSDAHKSVNDYLLSALKNTPQAEATSEYAALLNARSKARASLHAYIINLDSDDFDI